MMDVLYICVCTSYSTSKKTNLLTCRGKGKVILKHSLPYTQVCLKLHKKMNWNLWAHKTYSNGSSIDFSPASRSTWPTFMYVSGVLCHATYLPWWSFMTASRKQEVRSSFGSPLLVCSFPTSLIYMWETLFCCCANPSHFSLCCMSNGAV